MVLNRHAILLRKTLSAVVILLCISVLLVKIAQAQQNTPALQLTMSPTTIQVSVDPGQTIIQKFRVRNNGNTADELSITVDKLDPHTANGQVAPIAIQPDDTSGKWLTFDALNFTAPPQEWYDVTMTIAIPTDATLSNFYAVHIGQSKIPQTQGIGTKILGEIVLPVLVNVKSPNAKAEMQLVSFKPETAVNEYLPVNFAVTFKNTGNVALKPQGNIFIRTGGEKDIAALDVNPGAGIILPDGTRTFRVAWNDGFVVREPMLEDDGTPVLNSKNQPKSHLVIHWDQLTHFRIGKYPASLLVVYDNGTRDVPLEATTSFWVFPYTVIGIVFVAFAILALIIRTLLKLYIANELKKQKKHE